MRCVAAVRWLVVSLCGPVLSLAAQQPAGAARPSAAFNALLEGMACKQQPSGRMDCDFHVGGTRFVIAGVGQEDVAISFVQADTADPYRVSIAPLHGCVVVKPTNSAQATRTAGLSEGDSVATFAFVSPRTGKVYRSWQSCLSATRGDQRAADAKADAGPDATPEAKSDTAKRAVPSKASATKSASAASDATAAAKSDTTKRAAPSKTPATKSANVKAPASSPKPPRQ
ncbi:MAG TPA: hypothetical protein VF483_11150 [Gemmatimonadaceae bacterium]